MKVGENTDPQAEGRACDPQGITIVISVITKAYRMRVISYPNALWRIQFAGIIRANI